MTVAKNSTARDLEKEKFRDRPTGFPDGDSAVTAVESAPKNFAVRTDKSGGTEYVGLAAIGSAESSAVWQIQRLVTTGQNLTITWADGDDSFDNIWDDILTLSYS